MKIWFQLSGIEECWDEITYTLNETVFKTNTINTNNRSTNYEEYWKSNKGGWGQCHTFQYGNPLQSDPISVLEFGITPKATSYVLFVHDPKFYLISLKPLVVPSIILTIKVKASKGSRIYPSLT